MYTVLQTPLMRKRSEKLQRTIMAQFWTKMAELFETRKESQR